jgi:hypothetical protein
MKFLDILLKEGRKEDLKKKYFDKFDEEVLDFVLGISDLEDFNHKYTDFILRGLDQKNDVDLWIEVGIQLVQDFDKYQKNLQKKDINQYRSFEELEKALEPFKEKEKEKELENQTEKIYEDDNFLVLVPKTEEASCKYGSGTKWCVTQKGTGHFERYTRDKQGLYFIIRKKGKQTEPHYKVAVHINDIGNESWWDARDTRMNNEAVTLFKDYFPELYSKIIEDSKEKRKPNLQQVDEIFEEMDQAIDLVENFRNSDKDLKIIVTGFDRIPDMSGKATGSIKIFLGDELIDAYDMYVSYDIETSGQLKLSIGFDLYGELNDEGFEPKFDFEFWKGWGFDGNYDYTKWLTTKEMRNQILNWIASRIEYKINQITPFEAYVKNITGPTWRPNRFNYGYTFAKNDKGYIKKLTDWLAAGKVGTKLDFLTDIGQLDKKLENGKKYYSFKGKNTFLPSKNWRGQFSSFFASAKHAGILAYRKVGKDFLLIKGPNFDAFKEGKLTAI